MSSSSGTDRSDDAASSPAAANDEVRVTVDASGRRDVVVPLRLYKTVTVFSTLIAMVCVILGFVLLDAATLRVSVLRGVLTAVVPVAGDVLSAVLAVCGLVCIGVGAGVYTLGTRFRAHGMGKSQEDTGEESSNG